MGSYKVHSGVFSPVSVSGSWLQEAEGEGVPSFLILIFSFLSSPPHSSGGDGVHFYRVNFVPLHVAECRTGGLVGRYGLTFFAGTHFRPPGMETHVYPVPQTINGKGPWI